MGKPRMSASTCAIAPLVPRRTVPRVGAEELLKYELAAATGGVAQLDLPAVGLREENEALVVQGLSKNINIKQIHAGKVVVGIASKSDTPLMAQPHSGLAQVVAVLENQHVEARIMHPIYGAAGWAVADTWGLVGDGVAGGLA